MTPKPAAIESPMLRIRRVGMEGGTCSGTSPVALMDSDQGPCFQTPIQAIMSATAFRAMGSTPLQGVLLTARRCLWGCLQGCLTLGKLGLGYIIAHEQHTTAILQTQYKPAGCHCSL